MMMPWCTVCAAETALEPVPCVDDHGADCPELLCATCGYVVVVATVVEGSGASRYAAVAVPAA